MNSPATLSHAQSEIFSFYIALWRTRWADVRLFQKNVKDAYASSEHKNCIIDAMEEQLAQAPIKRREATATLIRVIDELEIDPNEVLEWMDVELNFQD